MPRGESLNARLARLIRESPLELTVEYPGARPVAPGTTPGAAPVSPFTGGTPTQQVYPAVETPSLPPVTMPCLWYDGFGGLETSLGRSRIDKGLVGWVEGAEALARVLAEHAASDPTDPLKPTVFTNAVRVVFKTHRYRVMAVQPLSQGTGVPLTYHIWLQGAVLQ